MITQGQEFFEDPINADKLPICQVCTKPIQVKFDYDSVGCYRVIFTLKTRHYLTEIPLNERLSHRHELQWLVYSISCKEIIGVISQTEASYQHPDIYLEFPRDSSIILVPASPYLVNDNPAIKWELFKTVYNYHSYRYEIQIGASADSSFIGDKWSYREGRLCFGTWFNNKPFRWAINGAELTLPAIPHTGHCVQLNILATTDFDILIGQEVVATCSRSTNGVRWHNDERRIDIPARLVTSHTMSLKFRFIGDNWQNIEFNLRQEGLALSRVIVDIFDNSAADIAAQLAELTWNISDTQAGIDTYPRLNEIIFDRDKHIHDIACTTVLIPELEFKIMKKYFSPHEQIWLNIYGLWTSMFRQGISVTIQALENLGSAQGSNSAIVGPLRFDCNAAELARTYLDSNLWSENRRGIILSHYTQNILLVGLPIDDDLLSSFAYRELFEARLTTERGSNFWEMIIVRPEFWVSKQIAIYENVLVGCSGSRPELLLASASAEDWIETGDPDALFVLNEYCLMVAGPPQISTSGLPCAVTFRGQQALVATYDPRLFSASGGSGIARGWPAFRGPEREAVRIVGPLLLTREGMEQKSEFSKLIASLGSVISGHMIAIEGNISAISIPMKSITGITP